MKKCPICNKPYIRINIHDDKKGGIVIHKEHSVGWAMMVDEHCSLNEDDVKRLRGE